MQQKGRLERFFTKYIERPRSCAIFLSVGVFLFVLLTYTTKVDVMTTCPATYRTEDGQGVVSFQGDVTPGEVVYLYSNRNEAVFRVEVEPLADGGAYAVRGGELPPDGWPDQVTADFPVDKVSLLYLIFVKGGVSL